MNRFAGIIITVVAIAALIGAALGWRFPFPGQNRTANRLGASPQTVQPANRTVLRAGQPTNSARGTSQTQTTAQVPNNTQTNTQSSDVNINPEATGSGTGQAETGGQPVSAFW